jgi:Type IV pili methyl-accepting chemotaxis transducer N-term
MTFRLKLSSKLVGVQVFFLAVALTSIGLSLFVSWRLEGNAAAINDAGSLRMRTYRLAFLASEVERASAVRAADRRDRLAPRSARPRVADARASVSSHGPGGAAVFGTQATGVLTHLVATRYGFHIIEVVRRIPGRALPFEHVQARIAEFLSAKAEARALAQYVQVLAGRARVAGIELQGAQTPLVQ